MAPVGIRYRSNTYQNIGCKFNKGCILFLICKNNRLKLQYPCICRYQSYQHEQTTTRNAQLPWKALLLAKTEITGEPALMLKLDYARKWIYAEELSPRSHARSMCGGFLANVKVKRDESCTGKRNTGKRILRGYCKPTKYRNEMRQSEDESSWEP